MGWSIGWDHNWNRDIGYGVPALCDHPKCSELIDRGLAYVCCGQRPYGGEDEPGSGCGLFFCDVHSDGLGRCARCRNGRRSKPYEPKPDIREWIEWKLTHESWKKWRAENSTEVTDLCAALPHAPIGGVEFSEEERAEMHEASTGVTKS